jgi:glycine cleavage system H lipoate-binding protein
VKSCAGANARKLIASNVVAAGEKCTSAAYRTCPVFSAIEHDDLPSRSCPLLAEPIVQYCAAAASPHYVPWSEHSSSRCGVSGHRYCELYLQMSGASHAIEQVEGIDVVPHLRYTRNHFWFDSGEDGWWNAGIDGLLARTLGHVDAVTFVTTPGVACPAVVVAVGTNDYTLTFPYAVKLTGWNSRLRADPDRLTNSPYTFGWLFEGSGDAPNGLLDGKLARPWMTQELDRASRVLHNSLGPNPADGGVLAPGVLREIDRETGFRFFHRMFSPLGGEQ